MSLTNHVACGVRIALEPMRAGWRPNGRATFRMAGFSLTTTARGSVDRDDDGDVDCDECDTDECSHWRTGTGDAAALHIWDGESMAATGAEAAKILARLTPRE
jgi:hypothetical protein